MSEFSHNEGEGFFGDFADSWWNKDGPVKTLHDLNPTRLEYIKQQVSLKNLRVADIGCGGGILSESMAQAGASVVGVDTSSELIQIAKDHAKEENLKIRYESTEVGSLAEKDPGMFDVVVCMELVEHVDDVYKLISDCARLLKKEGLLFISTLNRSIWSYFFGILAAEDLFKIVPKGTHDYNKFLKPSELSACCRSANLKNIDIKGLNYNPFTRKATLSRLPKLNYICTFSAL